MVTDVQPGGGEPTAESRVRNSFPGENSHENEFERSHDGRSRKQKPDLSLIKLEGFEVITQGNHDVKAPTEESSSSEAATTSMSSSSSMVTSSSKDFSPATNPLLTTGVFSDFSETTLSEIEEEVVTLQPSDSALDEEVVTKMEQDFESEEDEEAIEGELDSEDSDELSDYFYSIYGDEYPFDYADYLNYSDEDFEEGIISPGSPVKTFTVGHESVKGESEK